MKTTAKYLVKGHSNFGEEFEIELTFTMYKVKENDYGTGYYILMEGAATENYPPFRQSYDVRYQRTTDIDVLADRVIETYYGENAEEVIML